MAWAGYSRRRRLPPDWATIRTRILQRDPVCQLQYDCCTAVSTEVDHITPKLDDHQDHLLQGTCKPCHARKSATEGGTASQQGRPQRRRPPEQHPGIR